MKPRKEEPTPYEKDLRAAQNAMMKVYRDPEGDPATQIATLERHARFINGLVAAKQQEKSHDRQYPPD